MAKFIRVKMTPDPALNREAMDPDALAVIEKIKNGLGCELKLEQVMVRQGSKAARRIQRAHEKYRKK